MHFLNVTEKYLVGSLVGLVGLDVADQDIVNSQQKWGIFI